MAYYYDGQKLRRVIQSKYFDGQTVARVNKAVSYSPSLAFTSNGDGTCYVSGIGTVTATDIVIPSVSPAGDTVTKIGESAFQQTALTSVTIPDSVIFIGRYAFLGCSALTSATIGNGVTTIGDRAFYNCTSLRDATIGNSVRFIWSEAFRYCRSLPSIEIPDSVTSIGEAAFHGCTSLETVYITDLTKWCAISFNYSGANPLNNGADLILNGESVTALTIPDVVTSIANYAFCGCSSLTSVTIGNSGASIGDMAFYNCSNLTKLTIKDSETSTTSIGNSAFSNCTSLMIVTIGNGVTSIGRGAFYGCSSLTIVTIHATTPPILGDSYAFYDTNDCPISVPYFSDHSILNTYQTATNWSAYASRIYDEVPTLEFISNGDGTCVVNGIGTITSTNIIIPSVSPDGDTVIGISNLAFQGNQNIVSVTIPDSVEYISGSGSAGGAFESCYSLETVIIGSGVREIGQNVFYYCTALTSVTIYATTPPILEDTNAFYNTNNCPSYVPSASVNAYKAATNWSELANRIFAIQ